MNIHKIFLYSFLCFFSLTAVAQETGEFLKIPADAVVKKTPLNNGLSGAEIGLDIIINRDLKILGIPCSKEKPILISVQDDFWDCVLSENFQLNGIQLKKGTIGFFSISPLPPKYWKLVDVTGILPPQSSVSIKGIGCQEYLEFHNDGSLAECALASAQVFFKKIEFKAGTQIVLDEKGNLKQARILLPHSINGKEYPLGVLTFDADGNVTLFTPGEWAI